MNLFNILLVRICENVLEIFLGLVTSCGFGIGLRNLRRGEIIDQRPGDSNSHFLEPKPVDTKIQHKLFLPFFKNNAKKY